MADTPQSSSPTAPTIGGDPGERSTSGGGDGARGKLRESAGKATEAVRGEASTLATQAGEKARAFAGDGKARASEKLDDVARLIGEAADTVDDKVGEQYGAYARSAADMVSGFAEQLRAKDVDELVEDARAFVQKSPAVAIGAAAAVGFVLARLIRAGIEAADAPTSAGHNDTGSATRRSTAQSG